MASTIPPPSGTQLGPQTDFGRLRNGLQDVTTELGNLANLPAFDQGTAIMNMLRQIRHQNQQFRDQMLQFKSAELKD